MRRAYSLSIISAFLLFYAFSICNAPVEHQKPDRLLIIADDHTTQVIGCYNGFLRDYVNTFHISLLAPEGMLFNYVFCTNAIRSLARTTLLTGTCSHKNGVKCIGQTDLPATFPECEMFDLVSDPVEMNNIYNQPDYLDVQNQFKDLILEWQDTFDDTGHEYPELQN